MKGRTMLKNKKRGILLLLAGVLAACTGETALAEPLQEEKETFLYESPVFTGSGEECMPKETWEQGGKRYRLVSTNVRRAVQKGALTFVSSVIPYELEGEDEPPLSATIKVQDETAGIEYEREVPLLDLTEQGITWENGFSFSVTVSGYGAETLTLGTVEIPGDADLSEYGEELLEYLGLSLEHYRVDQVIWDGEPYEEGGIWYREAKAVGEKRIRHVEARYGGQVRTPDIEGKQYIGVYEAVMQETVQEETEKKEELETTTPKEPETAASKAEHPKKESIREQIFRWLTKNLTIITFSAGFFLFLGLGIFLLSLTFRKKKEGRKLP